jgi:hypothetical protein
MEALAMGLPALCVGFEYAGPVLRDNIGEHLNVNITGFGMGIDPRSVCDDVQTAATIEPSACRSLAEDYCSVQTFIDGMFETLADTKTSGSTAS